LYFVVIKTRWLQRINANNWPWPKGAKGRCSGQAAARHARAPRQLRRGGGYVLLQLMRLRCIGCSKRTPSSSELAGAPVAWDNGRINMQSAN